MAGSRRNAGRMRICTIAVRQESVLPPRLAFAGPTPNAVFETATLKRENYPFAKSCPFGRLQFRRSAP